MDRAAPPEIFSPKRLAMARQRMGFLQRLDGAAQFLAADASEDILERISFLRHQPKRSLVIGDSSGLLPVGLKASCPEGSVKVVETQSCFAIEEPWPISGFDLIAALFVIENANDLPGTLIHLRNALAPGGLAIAVMTGAGSLPALRRSMLAADGDRPAPRLHPQVDVRAGGQLLQRAGWERPVVDSRSVSVRYRSLEQLVADLRSQGLGNVLADPGPPFSRTAWQRARSEFAKSADESGRVTESFEVITLSGWRT